MIRVEGAGAEKAGGAGTARGTDEAGAGMGTDDREGEILSAGIGTCVREAAHILASCFFSRRRWSSKNVGEFLFVL